MGILRVYMGRDDLPEPDILAISRQVLGMWVGGIKKAKTETISDVEKDQGP